MFLCEVHKFLPDRISKKQKKKFALGADLICFNKYKALVVGPRVSFAVISFRNADQMLLFCFNEP